MSKSDDLKQAIAASNLFAKALSGMIEEGEGILLKTLNDTKDYEKGELVAVSKLHGAISIVPMKSVIDTDTSELQEGQWVKLNGGENEQS